MRQSKESESQVVLTVPEAASLLRLSRATAYQGVREGSIPAIRIGRRLLVPRARLMAMLSAGEVPKGEAVVS